MLSGELPYMLKVGKVFKFSKFFFIVLFKMLAGFDSPILSNSSASLGVTPAITK